MGGGKHPRWPEIASAQLREPMASLSWEDLWTISESRKGDDGTVHGLNSTEAKALPVLVGQTNSENLSGMSEEHSDVAPVSRTVFCKSDDQGSDASLTNPSVRNSVRSEPEASYSLPLDLSWFSEPLVPRKVSKLKRRSFQSEEFLQESLNSGKSEGLLAKPPVSSEKQKWRTDMHKKILRQRNVFEENVESIRDRRDRVLSYRPGAWLSEAGGVKRNSYDIPDITTLLVVGPKGAGKSTLINNMIRVVNNKMSKFDRAQTCGDLSENGTLFLHEHMLCDGSQSICVYDSRGLSEVDTAEAQSVLRSWLEKGVRHGQMVVRPSDSNSARHVLESKARHGHSKISKKRDINFVIFVVNAISLNNMRKSSDWPSRMNLIKLFKSPFLSFRDDMPVVVMTHGDELSLDDRIEARIFLGDLFGLSPADHVFDIPGFVGRVVHDGDIDPVDDLALLDMLEYALERADRNLPYKQPAILHKVGSQAYAHLVNGKDLSVRCCGIVWQTFCHAFNTHNPNCLEIVIIILTVLWGLAVLLLLLILNLRGVFKLISVGRI